MSNETSSRSRAASWRRLSHVTETTCEAAAMTLVGTSHRDFLATSTGTSLPCCEDRQTDTTPRKAGHPSHVSIATTKKVPFAFRDQLLTGRDGTLLCSAGPEWYGYLGIIDTEASTWAPAVGRPSVAMTLLEQLADLAERGLMSSLTVRESSVCWAHLQNPMEDSSAMNSETLRACRKPKYMQTPVTLH